MKILIDNGHGRETPGKRIPDGRLLEYAQNRLLARGIVDGLTARGRCRHLGYLRNSLAEGDCAAGVVFIVIPGYVERWGYALDKYQVYVLFVLLDTVTGYRSQYQQGAFCISV